MGREIWTWTEELDGIFIREWRRNTPIEEIGRLCGVNKKAVSQHAYILRGNGVSLRRRSNGEEERYTAAYAAAVALGLPTSPEDPDEDVPDDKPHPIQMKPWAEVGAAPRKCQWLRGEPRKRNFCGAKTKPGSSYCDGHHKRAYHKVRFVRRPGGGIAAVRIIDPKTE